MICPQCGCDNSADEKYCDDCGALLEEEVRGPEGAGWLEPGQQVGGCCVVENVICRDSACTLYGVRYLNQESESPLMLLCEFPDSPAKAQEVQQLLSGLDNAHLWRPSQVLCDGETNRLLGELPASALSDLIGVRAFTAEEAIRISMGLAQGLEVLHRAGFIHKCLAPGSIWLNEDDAPVIVRFEQVQKSGQTAEAFAVAEGYSAPECYGMGDGICDVRTDVYGLGAVLYSLLAGSSFTPDKRDSSFIYPALADLSDPVGKAARRVLRRALRRNKDQRFADIPAMRLALQQALEGIEAAEQVTVSAALDPETTANPAKEDAPAPECADTGAKVRQSLMRLEVGMRTHVGMVRKVNQDALVDLTLNLWERSVHSKMRFLAVIDGMGGEAEGDKAASLAARSLIAELVERTAGITQGTATSILLPQDPVERGTFLLTRALTIANENIFRYALLDPSRRGMGCTVTCAIFDKNLAVFGHVGDTRGYVFDGTMDQVTEDHSMVGQLVQMGTLTREEARRSPRRSIIYRALGTTPGIEVATYSRRLKRGDYVMMSSDGIWEYFTDQELLSRFNHNEHPQDICNGLVETVLDRGADDNCTVAVARLI